MPNRFNRGYSFAEITTKDGVSEIQILRTGNWKHPTYGEFNIAEKDLNEFIANFKNNVRGVDLAVDINHDPEHKAVGWFKDVYKKGKALFAKIEWTKEGLELVKTKTYRYFSPELHFVFQDEESGDKIRNVLVGGGITNRPFFKGMQALQMSEPESTNAKNILFYNTENMKFSEILKTLTGKTNISLEELDQARLAFSELSEADQDAHAQDIAAIEAKFNEEEGEDQDDGEDGEDEGGEDEGKEGEGDDEGEGKEDEDEGGEGKEGEGEEEDKEGKEFSESEEGKAFNEMLKKTTGMTLDEVKGIQKKFSEQAKELKFKELGEKVSALVFSEANKTGAFLPKSKDKLVGFLSKLNDNLVKEFFEVVPGAVKTVEFKEIGAEGGEGAGAKTFSVPAKTPKGVDRESFVLAEVAKHFSEKEGLEIGAATLKAADYIAANNLK